MAAEAPAVAPWAVQAGAERSRSRSLLRARLESLRLRWPRACAVAALWVAAQLLIASWFGASESSLVAEQIPYLISGGFGAALIVAIACTLWLSGDLVDEWRKLAELDRALDEARSHLPARTTRPVTRPTPWTVPQVLFTISAMGIGALAVAVGWFGASGQSKPSAQLGWFAVAAVGLGAQGLGVAGHVLNGRRSVGTGREELWRSIMGGDRQSAETPEPAPSRADEDLLVAGSAMTRYHRPGCALVQGKAVQGAPLRLHLERQRRPCGVCLPGKSDAGGGATVRQEAELVPHRTAQRGQGG